MSRDRRCFIEGGVYHVLIRGHNRSCIFEQPADKAYFLRKLKALAQREKIHVLYYVLMDNHYHMILQQMEGSISRFMQAFNQAYARYYNRRYQRSGTVYGRRFSCFTVKDLRYLKNLILYIAYNPVKAGIVKQATQYKWCAHIEMTSSSRFKVVAAEVLFKLLGSDKGNGQLIYERLLSEPNRWLDCDTDTEESSKSISSFIELRLIDQFNAELRAWVTDARTLYNLLDGRGNKETIALRKALLRRGAEAGYGADIMAQGLGISVRRVYRVAPSQPPFEKFRDRT